MSYEPTQELVNRWENETGAALAQNAMRTTAVQMLAELAPCFAGESRQQWPGVFCTLAKRGVVWMLTAFRLDGWPADDVVALGEAFAVPEGTEVHTTESGRRVTMQWEVGE